MIQWLNLCQLHFHEHSFDLLGKLYQNGAIILLGFPYQETVLVFKGSTDVHAYCFRDFHVYWFLIVPVDFAVLVMFFSETVFSPRPLRSGRGLIW